METFKPMTMSTQAKDTFKLTPKALIFMSLGGYTGEAAGSGGMKKSQLIQKDLAEYLAKNNLCIESKNGNLTFSYVTNVPPNTLKSFFIKLLLPKKTNQ